jgi:hypothetical protein
VRSVRNEEIRSAEIRESALGPVQLERLLENLNPGPLVIAPIPRFTRWSNCGTLRAQPREDSNGLDALHAMIGFDRRTDFA